MNADGLIVGLIVGGALGYLLTRLRAKKGNNCCGGKVNGKHGA